MLDQRKTVKDYIRTIVDFPHEGIMFRDVTTLFADARGFRMCIDQLLHPYAGRTGSTRSWGSRRGGSSSAAPSRIS
jgi:adenine/guanine phosphoribosyltransferase-like PRPP-binding protein